MPFLRTLGQSTLEGVDTGSLSSPRKAAILLTYLARRGSRPVARAQLAALLWEDRPEAKGRQSLRQALLELNRIAPDALEIGDEQVALRGGIETDAELFERDLAAGRVEEAVARWGGDFLAGTEDAGGESFRAWLEAERESLRHQFALACASLVDRALRRGAADDAVRAAERWAQALPLDERAHGAWAETLERAGRASEAVRVLRQFGARMRAELELEPPAALTRRIAELETAVRSAARAGPGSVAVFTPDLVGRGAALAELGAAWEAAVAGRAGGVLIEGEAGIGKTRLAEEFVRSVDQSGGGVTLRVRAADPLGELALRAVRDLTQQLANAPGLSGAPAGALAELALLVPVLRERFSALPAALGEEAALEAALAEALAAVTDERPVLLWIDDFPLLDPASQRTLLAATDRARGRLLYLILARSEERPSRAVAVLTGRTAVRRLPLQPLDLAEVDALLSSMLALDPEDGAAVASHLHAAAAGNPLHTIELAVGLIDEGALAPTPHGRWHLTTAAGDRLPLPATLRDALLRRLARLSEPTRLLAEAAAVLGPEFDPRVAAELAALPQPDAQGALEELLTRRLIRRGSHEGGTHQFSHPLVRRAAYEAMTPERRRALHAEAARLLASSADAGAVAAVASHRRLAAGSPRPARGRGLARPLVGVAALLAVLLGAWVVGHGRGAPALTAVAVLPFADLSPGGDAEYFGDGLAEELINALSGVKGLQVAARSSAFRFRQPALDLHDVGSRLGVGSVVEGSVRRDGDRLRITAQLISVRDGYLRWSATYDRELKDVFGVQEAIAQAVLDELLPRLGGRSASRAVRAGTADPEAHNLYLRGRYAWNKRTPDGLKQAIHYFEQAIARDSTYAQAYVGLADGYLSLFDYELLPFAEATPPVRAALSRALTLDSTLADGHSSLAHLYLHEWQWDPAVQEFKHAIELDPGRAPTYHWYALALTSVGKLDEAVGAMKRAWYLDPLSARMSADLGMAYLAARRYDQAIEQERRTLELEPKFGTSYWIMGVAYEQKGLLHEARDALRRALELAPDNPNYLAELARVHALDRRPAEARKLIADLRTRTGEQAVSPFFIALAYSALGERDSAFHWLEQSVAERSGSVRYLKVEPRLDPLRSDPRFARLLRQVGLEP